MLNQITACSSHPFMVLSTAFTVHHITKFTGPVDMGYIRSGSWLPSCLFLVMQNKLAHWDLMWMYFIGYLHIWKHKVVYFMINIMKDISTYTLHLFTFTHFSK